jgi:hypothetical protein
MGLTEEECENIVLDCYWLAQWYHQSPEHFLAMPLSDVRRHVVNTIKLAEMRRAARSSDG